MKNENKKKKPGYKKMREVLSKEFYTDEYFGLDEEVFCLLVNLEEIQELHDTTGVLDENYWIGPPPTIYICDRSMNPNYETKYHLQSCRFEPGTEGFAKFAQGDKVVPVCEGGKYDSKKVKKIIEKFLLDYWWEKYHQHKNWHEEH